ncbi:MAG: nuclear transport factor 2 family protein [Pseudomonadota bacterium]|nr:nuclear transport factor 2 family protein [Pseudomonadota bacterium]
MFRSLLLALILIASPAAAKPADPKAVVEELLAADRAFSARAEKSADPVAGVAPMFDTEVVMPSPKGHAVGREAVLALFRENPSYKEGKVSWTPVRGGISADGTQGFTYGYFSLTGGDPARRERKYLAYWVKRPDGWRAVAYRQQVREAGEVSKAMIPPSLPPFSAEPVSVPEAMKILHLSVAAAEKSFSDRAQKVGLKTAFREYGRKDAMNMYGGASFAIGLDAVTAGFREGEPATIHWYTERSYVASSGDLGVSIGTIKPNDPKGGAGFPFFTVWRRDGPNEPWRYVAE